MAIVQEEQKVKCPRCHHEESVHIDNESEAFQQDYPIGTCTVCEPYEPCGHVTLSQQAEEIGTEAHDLEG